MNFTLICAWVALLFTLVDEVLDNNVKRRIIFYSVSLAVLTIPLLWHIIDFFMSKKSKRLRIKFGVLKMLKGNDVVLRDEKKNKLNGKGVYCNQAFTEPVACYHKTHATLLRCQLLMPDWQCCDFGDSALGVDNIADKQKYLIGEMTVDVQSTPTTQLIMRYDTGDFKIIHLADYCKEQMDRVHKVLKYWESKPCCGFISVHHNFHTKHLEEIIKQLHYGDRFYFYKRTVDTTPNFFEGGLELTEQNIAPHSYCDKMVTGSQLNHLIKFSKTHIENHQVFLKYLFKHYKEKFWDIMSVLNNFHRSDNIRIGLKPILGNWQAKRLCADYSFFKYSDHGRHLPASSNINPTTKLLDFLKENLLIPSKKQLNTKKNIIGFSHEINNVRKLKPGMEVIGKTKKGSYTVITEIDKGRSDHVLKKFESVQKDAMFRRRELLKNYKPILEEKIEKVPIFYKTKKQIFEELTEEETQKRCRKTYADALLTLVKARDEFVFKKQRFSRAEEELNMMKTYKQQMGPVLKKLGKSFEVAKKHIDPDGFVEVLSKRNRKTEKSAVKTKTVIECKNRFSALETHLDDYEKHLERVAEQGQELAESDGIKEAIETSVLFNYFPKRRVKSVWNYCNFNKSYDSVSVAQFKIDNNISFRNPLVYTDFRAKFDEKIIDACKSMPYIIQSRNYNKDLDAIAEQQKRPRLSNRAKRRLRDEYGKNFKFKKRLHPESLLEISEKKLKIVYYPKTWSEGFIKLIREVYDYYPPY